MLARQLSIPCVGLRYPNKKGGNRQFEIAMCERGELLTLEHEPRNPADGNAIKVISSRSIQMGYVSAERTSLIYPIADLGSHRRVRMMIRVSGPTKSMTMSKSTETVLTTKHRCGALRRQPQRLTAKRSMSRTIRRRLRDD